MKRSFKILLLVFLIFTSLLTIGNFSTYQNLIINTKETFNLSINFFDARDIFNQIIPSCQLKLIFIEEVYTNLIKEELNSFKTLTIILSKPYRDFWIVKEIIEFIKQTKYLILNIRKLFSIILKVFRLQSLQFNLSTHLQTTLSSYPAHCGMVLRC